MAEPERKVEELKRGELIAALEHSRVEISDDLVDLGDSLSFTRRVHRSYQSHPERWLGASAVIGFLLARPLLSLGSGKSSKGDGKSGKKTAKAVSGLLTIATKQASKMAVPLLRTAITGYVSRLLSPHDSDDNGEDDSPTLD